MENIKRKFTLSETNTSQDGEEPPKKIAKETPVEGNEKEGASDPKDGGRAEVPPNPEPLSGEALKLALGQEDGAPAKPEAIEVLKSSSDQEESATALPKLTVEDEQPSGSKNLQVASKESASGGANGDGPWIIGKRCQVRIIECRGRKGVDIRDCCEKDDKVLLGKKGIALSVREWKKMMEVADEITQAVEN